MAPLRTPVFELTSREKLLFRRDIESLLRQCERILVNDRYKLSVVDYSEAFRLVKEALMLANDNDACESAPLARCNLYKDHILRGLRKYPEARDAYLSASKVRTNDSLDIVASRTAWKLVPVMEKRILEKKRKGGIWEMCSGGAGAYRESNFLCLDQEGRDQRLKKIGTKTEVWDPEPTLKVRLKAIAKKTC